MNLVDVVMKSNLPQGCKLYYQNLYKRHNLSIRNNWIILNGKYKDHNFILAKDSDLAKKQGVSRTSIHNYKKLLKSFGFIDTIGKCTTKTSICKNNHYQQLTILANKLPRKFISSNLRRPVAFFKATLQKTYTNIITQSKRKINKVCNNLHKKIIQS